MVVSKDNGNVKIAVDTHFITSGHATGNRTYTAELLQALIALDTPHEFILYAIEDHPYYRQFAGNPRVTVRYVLSPKGIVRNFFSIPRALSEDRPDVAHLLFIHPPFCAVPVVLTVHDLFYVHQKDVGPYNRMIGKLTTWSIPRAARVITISEYSRQDILAHTGVAPEHVVSIPLGTDSRFTPTHDPAPVRAKLGIEGGYILYVGRTEDPRKNLATLIDAYAEARRRGIGERLVIAGRHGAGTEQLFRKVAELGLEEWVLFPGIVADEDLAPLICGADMFVYVSSFEGFGLPVLEAMGCGIPVITSSGTSLSEVAGDAALMVPPGSVPELVEALVRLRNDQVLRDTLRQRGLERILRYTWETTARDTLNVYSRVVGK